MSTALLLLALLSASALAAPTLPPAPRATANATDSQGAIANQVNPLLAILTKLPGLGQSVSAISGGLTTFEQLAATTLNIDDTENGTGCTAMTIIFARGTTEPGNVGIVAGPPFFSALKSMVGASAVTVQGVDYPADVPGFLEGGDPKGSQTMATMISTALSKCPKTKLVISGYSQGGQLVHNAAKLLPASTMAKVNSVVIFGDPDNGAAVTGASASKTKVICHDGDNICAHGDLILLPHLTYGENATEAASFVATVADLAVGN